jgi:hypothetical protein
MMGTMKPATHTQLPSAEQLTLLSTVVAPATPARFRLSRETRERGLRHVAEIRRMLAERADLTAMASSAEVLQDRAA